MIVLTELLPHREDSQLCSTFQSGYLSKYRTETAFLRLFNDWLTAGDMDQVSVLALIDLNAAFDTLDQSRLLYCLRRVFSVQDIALLLFESYSSDRSHVVFGWVLWCSG